MISTPTADRNPTASGDTRRNKTIIRVQRPTQFIKIKLSYLICKYIISSPQLMIIIEPTILVISHDGHDLCDHAQFYNLLQWLLSRHHDC